MTSTTQPVTRCLIAEAVEPLRAAAIRDAVAAAATFVERVQEKLAEHGGNFSSAYPFPRNCSRADYFAGMTDRTMAEALIPWHGVLFGKPPPAVVNAALVASFFESVGESASSAFDAYAEKLRGKIGAVTQASLLLLDDIWSCSLLTVLTCEGDVQKWKTQRVLNISSLGKLFHQWPTRRVK